jgi:hypothetical protein
MITFTHYKFGGTHGDWKATIIYYKKGRRHEMPIPAQSSYLELRELVDKEKEILLTI